MISPAARETTIAAGNEVAAPITMSMTVDAATETNTVQDRAARTDAARTTISLMSLEDLLANTVTVTVIATATATAVDAAIARGRKTRTSVDLLLSS
jgi:hypothetical protein